MNGVNRWLDRLPRPRVGLVGREAPAFRTCGITGFYVGVILTLAAVYAGVVAYGWSDALRGRDRAE